MTKAATIRKTTGIATELARRGSACWDEGARLIETVYRRSYGAVIPAHADEMLLARNRHGRVVAATGLREAATGFFSQVYLDRPTEQAISAGLRQPVRRDQILEVVTLAAIAPTAILPLFAGVIAEGHRRAKTCCLFTATDHLRGIFARLGLGLTELAPANAARLDNADTWGRYYATDPMVCVIPDRPSLAENTASARTAA